LTRCSFPFSLFSKSKKGRKKLSPPVNFQANIEAHYSHYNNTRLVSHSILYPHKQKIDWCLNCQIFFHTLLFLV
jgi:hypothetical protein